MESTEALDSVGAAILAVLQRDGRRSIADLGRDVNMSASAVGERVRRLEEAGVILGYAARIDVGRLGYPITAFLRLRYLSTNTKPLTDLLTVTPEIIEAHHVTGDDCYILRAVATSMSHLEQVAGRFTSLGLVTTSIVYSTPLPLRPVPEPPGSDSAYEQATPT